MILKECFTNSFIESRAGTNIHKKRIYEKVVHAFYLLEKLANGNIEFVFKGGTSLMLLINEFNRFSIDIDIMMNKCYENMIVELISNTDEIFYKIEEDFRKPKDIIKKHFKFYFNSIYSENNNYESYILLDIVFDELKYKNSIKKEINSHFVKCTDPLLSVNIPSIDEMLGDKLTAFAPKTIGILYKSENQKYSKHVEIIKQIYDVAKLYDHMKDLNIVKQTFNDVAKIQIKNRKLDVLPNDCIKDTIEACKLIISEGRYGGTKEEYELLKKGYIGFKNYVVSNFMFNELLVMACKIYILSIRLLFEKESFIEEKPINTFIGKRYKYVRQIVGEVLYSKLMKSCYLENNY